MHFKYLDLTFDGLYTKWDSFTPHKYKVNLIPTLACRCFRICSSPTFFQFTLSDFRKLGYPQRFIIYNTNDVFNKKRNKLSSPVFAVPKKDLIFTLFRFGEQLDI